MVDVINKTVTDIIEVEPSAETLISDREGEAVSVSSTGISRPVRLGPAEHHDH